MTNYNERLDEILRAKFSTKPDGGAWCLHHLHKLDLGICASCEAKQAITSLIKELVAEAKPAKRNTDVGDAYQRTFCGEYNKGIDQFEQNLLKALEEV